MCIRDRDIEDLIDENPITSTQMTGNEAVFPRLQDMRTTLRRYKIILKADPQQHELINQIARTLSYIKEYIKSSNNCKQKVNLLQSKQSEQETYQKERSIICHLWCSTYDSWTYRWFFCQYRSLNWCRTPSAEIKFNLLLWTSAVKIKVMDDYTTTSFIQAFTRFSCDHGYPKRLLCDEGSQLVKRCKEMLLSWTNLKSKLMTDWCVNFDVCPMQGHNMHGKVERRIREINSSNEKNLQHHRLSLLQWGTLASNIANQINNLPFAIGDITGPHYN